MRRTFTSVCTSTGRTAEYRVPEIREWLWKMRCTTHNCVVWVLDKRSYQPVLCWGCCQHCEQRPLQNMLSDCFFSVVKENDDFCFHQDVARCHTSSEIIVRTSEKFPQKIVSLRGHQEWPARSCDLWNQNKQQTICQLEDEIESVISGIPPDVFVNASSKISMNA